MDRDYLDWPFFAPRHREIAQATAHWIRSHLECGHGEEDRLDLDATCRALVRKLGASGVLATAIPEPGSAFDLRGLCLIRELLAWHSGLAESAFGVQGLGAAAIQLFGTAFQQDRFLPPLAKGQEIAAFALSEPDAGSDVAALRTTATPVAGGWHLNGTKTWISNGGIADLYTVFARTGEASGAKGLSAFIVPASSCGFSIAERIAIIAPHPLARLQFDRCFIPREYLIGRQGDGFTIAMTILDLFRTSVGAAALGFARRAFDDVLAHIRDRRVFGGRLADLQQTQAKIADMAVLLDTAALGIYRAAWVHDTQTKRLTAHASMAKLHATESAQYVVDQAVQLFGGLGVTHGTPVEALYREIRALRIYDGATEIQKLILARHILKAS